MTMRAAMEWQHQAQRCRFGAGQQQSIRAKIVEPMMFSADRREHAMQRRTGQQLQRQQMMPLQARIVTRLAAAINCAKWQVLSQMSDFCG